MIEKDFIQELLIKPTPDDLNTYRRMGLEEYVSPTGARYPLAQDYFSPPKTSRINRDFVDSLLAGEHPEVQESKLPPMADPDQPLDFFADPIPPVGIPEIADPKDMAKRRKGYEPLEEKLGIPEILKGIREMIAPTTEYTKEERALQLKETPEKILWMLKYVPTLGGRLGGKDFRKNLLEQAEEFAGFGPALGPAVGESTVLSLEWGVVYPYLFKLAGLGGAAVSKIPRVAKATAALKKAGGLEKLAEKFPRLYARAANVVKAMGKGSGVGGFMGAIETIGKDMEPDEILQHIGKDAAIMAGVAGVFQGVSEVDTAIYTRKLRTALIKASNSRFAAKLREVDAMAKSTVKTAAYKSLSSLKKAELQAIDKIVSATEANLLGLKKNKLYQLGQEVVERPDRAAQRLMKYGLEKVGEVPKGVETLKKGLGKTEPFIKMPLTRTAEAIESTRELGALLRKPSRIAERILRTKLPAKPTKVTPAPVVPPTEAIAEPEKPVAPITKPEAKITPTVAKAEAVISNPEIAKVIDDAKPDILSGIETGKAVTVDVVRGSGRATKGEVYESGEGEPAFGKARYSAIDEKFAKHFGPKIERLTVQLNNPFVLTNDEQLAELVGEPVPRENALRPAFLKKAREAIEQQGHDGIIINVPQFGDVDTAGKSAKRLVEISGATQVIEFQPPTVAKAEPAGEVEKIRAVATRIKATGQVAEGIDHADSTKKANILRGKDPEQMGLYPSDPELEQGFTTSEGRFVSREEAAKIAKVNFKRLDVEDLSNLSPSVYAPIKAKPVAKAEPTKVEPEVTDEDLSGITKRERRRLIKETATKIEQSDIYQTEVAAMDTMAREVGPGYYYINKGYRGEVEAIIGKRKGPGTKIQRMFTFNPNEKRIITLQTGEKTEIGPTPWERAVQEGLGRGKEGVDETWGEMDISEFVQRVVDSYEGYEKIGGVYKTALERAEQSEMPDEQMLAEKMRLLVSGTSDAEINQMITDWAEEYGIDIADIEDEFINEYGTKLRQIKKMEDPDAALEQLAREQIEAEDRQAAADAAREVLEANDIQAEVEQVEEISERPTDLIGRPLLEGGAAGKQRGLGELGLEFTKPEVKDPDQLEFGDAIPFERRGRPVGAAITQGQKEVILLAFGADSETGYHEGYHLLRRRLNDKARKILDYEFKGDEEAEARRFAEFVKTGKTSSRFRVIWQKLLNILRKIKSGLQGRGFRTAEDIFAGIREGIIEKIPAKAGIAYETRGEKLRREAEKNARIKARKARLAAQAGIKAKKKVKAPWFKIKIRDTTPLLGKEYQEGAPRFRRKEAPLKIPIKDVTPPLSKEMYPELEDIEVLTDEQITKAEMGEIPIEGEYKSQSDAFNEHLDYFQNRQLPKKSKIRIMQAQIRTINGQRLAGKISAQKANNIIRHLRKHLFITARKEGIALRMTRGGKLSLSVRKAGTYVPEEFAQYGKFKNIKPILGGGQDITRAIQQMDGSLSVKGKLRVKGQAGPLERHVLWPTRDISLQKLNYIKEKTAELKSIFKTKKGSKEDEQVNLVLEQIAKEDRDTPIKDILSRKTLRAIASPKVIRQALGLREFYDNLIDEQNLAREMRNQDPIPYRHNYSPHILRDTTIWERLMMRGKKPKDIKADLPDYIKPNAPFNPRAMAREAGIPYEERIKSAQNLAENYLVTAAKDIFNTSIVQNNKAFIQQIEAMGYDKSANYLADWTAEAYAGIKPRLDRAIQIGRKAEKSARYFNRLRNMAVFPLNFSWSLLTQTSSLALTVGRYGTTNTMRGFVQWLNPKIRKRSAEDYYSYVVKSERQGKITRQDAQNLIGVNVKLRRTKTEIAHDISTLLLDQLEKLLTGTSIRAAHLHGQKRGLTGEALKNYASDGGAKTQSMYNDEDKPALLRNLLVKTGAPYQTFAYEVVNTMREWVGRTGTPPNTKLYTIWTIIRFLAAAAVFSALGKKYANKEIWSWKRPPIPFAEFWLNPIIRMFSNQWIGSASGLTSPVETAQRVAKGIEDVLETGSWRKLRNELTKYGPGIFGIPGGIQISRTVDAIIAYAQGGVKDRKGRLLFEMEDPQDLAQAIFSGVWSTEGGRAYLDLDYRLKNMTVKELRQYRRKNTYQKTQYPKSKGIIKGRPHKGREQLVEKIDKELKKRE